MRETPRIRIVLADDDADDRELMHEALTAAFGEQRHFEIDSVSDGEALLRLLENDCADGASGAGGDQKVCTNLVLLDLNMPRLDGREALRSIRQNATTRAIPIVILTTSHSADDIRSSYELGVNSYITKPARYSEVMDLARQLVSYWFSTVELPRGRGGSRSCV